MVDRDICEAPGDGLFDEGRVRNLRFFMESRVQESDRNPISKSRRVLSKIELSQAIFHKYW